MAWPVPSEQNHADQEATEYLSPAASRMQHQVLGSVLHMPIAECGATISSAFSLSSRAPGT